MELRKRQGVPAGKQWRRHQLLGALSITIPLDKVEAMAESRIRSAFVWIVGVLAINNVPPHSLRTSNSRPVAVQEDGLDATFKSASL